MNTSKNSQKGFAQIIILGVMALSIVSLSVATKFAQKNQDNRSKAAEGESVPMLTLNEKAFALGVGQSYQLRAFLGSVDVTNSVTWSVGGTGVSTVNSSGLVTMLMENASNYVTAKTADGKEAIAQVFGYYSKDRVDAVCGTANGKTFSSLLLEADAISFFCKESVAGVVNKKSENIYSWTCVGANGGINANCSATIDPMANTAKSTLSATEVSMYYGFRDRNDYRTLGVGMTIVSSIRLYTGGKGISSAKIVYNHTDKLSPILNGVTGDQLASVVSHKNLENGFNELVVNFDKNKKLTDGVAYEIKIMTKIVKLGSGTLSFNTSNSFVYGLNNEVVPFSNTIDGTNFDTSSATNLPPTSKSRIYFESSKMTRYIDETFEVDVSVDSDTNKISGVDIVGRYDATKLELISMKKSDSFVFGDVGDCAVNTNDVGKILASCWLKESTYDRPALGKLITMVFKAKAEGAAEFSFDCVNGSTEDSNIVGIGIGEDIIACNENMKMHITVVSPENLTITPSPVSKVNGKCGKSTSTPCLDGNVSWKDRIGNDGSYNWSCLGKNGGSNVNCSLTKSINKYDAVCGNSKNSCTKGKLSDTADTNIYYTWICKGTNGGVTKVCRLKKPVLNRTNERM